MESIKNDRKDGKVRMDLLPLQELYEIAKVYTMGAEKYGENRWQNLPDGYERYRAALLRHMVQAQTEDKDSESGLPHEAHIAWNAIAMLHFKLQEKKTT